MPGLAEIGGGDRMAVQTERYAMFQVEFAFERAGRFAPLAASDLLGRRADLGPYRSDAAVLGHKRRECAGGIDRRMRQMAGGIRLEAVVQNAPAGEIAMESPTRRT